MTNKETAKHCREYVQGRHSQFSWPTDDCGYDQHVRFVQHKNDNWMGESRKEFVQFILDYAGMLEKEEVVKWGKQVIENWEVED